MTKPMHELTGPELDAAVALEVLGRDLRPPHRDVALVAVGQKHVRCTGPTFTTHDPERQIPMPDYTKLRKPQGQEERNMNDRYFLHVAEVLGDAVRAEVDAYRIPARRYSSDAEAMLDLMDMIAAKAGVVVGLAMNSPGGPWCVQIGSATRGAGVEAPRVVALVALKWAREGFLA